MCLRKTVPDVSFESPDVSFESPGSGTMFAIIEDGSHQYRVEPGQSLTVDYRSEANAGDTIEFDRVLLANGGGSSTVGRPTIEGATVTTEVITPELKGKKLEIQSSAAARTPASTLVTARSTPRSGSPRSTSRASKQLPQPRPSKTAATNQLSENSPADSVCRAVFV
jgi:large subunit ribosomal protein L21